MLHLKLPALIVVISLLHQGASSCLQNALPQEAWTSDAELEEFRIRDRSDERALFLMPRDFVFTCNGTIQRWVISWFYRDAFPNCATINFIFYILRQSLGECGITTIEGQNLFSERVTSSSDSTVVSVFDVDLQDRIHVQVGDFVGVTMELASSDCNDIRARIKGERGTPSTVYYGLFSNIAQALLPGRLTVPCSSYTQDQLLLPYITAVVDPVIETVPEPGREPPSTSIEDNQQPTTAFVKPTSIGTSVTNNNVQVTDSKSTPLIKPDATATDARITLLSTSYGVKINANAMTTLSGTTVEMGRNPLLQSDSGCCRYSSSVQSVTVLISMGEGGTSVRGGGNDVTLLLIGVGGTSCALFLLITCLFATACCLLRCHKLRQRNRDSLKQDRDKRGNHDYTMSRADPLYDYPHDFNHQHVHGDSLKANGAYGSGSHQLGGKDSNGVSSANVQIFPPQQPEFEDSMQINGAYGSIVSLPVEELKEHQVITLKEGHGFMMSINGSYGSLKTP